ncbi:hypothetical protein LAZ67_13001058 [Cordylochernes scorpioides]|uniref:Uncharacterized protein n=1 Tax=Cordylochernes scorpioides TaxID=51811 RepID=A0ABY6L3I0_9ARAC|nr:hypothetical protein LAZ67_13001058 [Cordylochernes scorpioides]
MLTIHQWAREKFHFSSEKMKDRLPTRISKRVKWFGSIILKTRNDSLQNFNISWKDPKKSSTASMMSSTGDSEDSDI